MSVLLSKRSQSKAEFVNKAVQIQTRTLNFLSKMSNRYGRLLADETMKLALQVVIKTEEANSIRIIDESTFIMRRNLLIEASITLNALDVMLATVFETLMLNPQGAFTTSTGKTVSETDAIHRLNTLTTDLGLLIDEESNLIKRVIESDKARYSMKQ